MTPPMQAVMPAQSPQRKRWLLSWQAGSVATQVSFAPCIVSALLLHTQPPAEQLARPSLLIACDLWDLT